MSLCFYKSEETFGLVTVQMLYVVNHCIAQKNPTAKQTFQLPVLNKCEEKNNRRKIERRDFFFFFGVNTNNKISNDIIRI